MSFVPPVNQSLSLKDIRAIGQIFNDTYGRSTTRDAGYGINASLQGNNLILKYQTIVQYHSVAGLEEQQKKYEKESNDVIAQGITEAKKQFRDLAGRTLSLNEVSNETSMEAVSASPHSPRKIAYYRRTIVFELS